MISGGSGQKSKEYNSLVKRRRVQSGDTVEFWEHKPGEAIFLGIGVVKYVDSRNKQIVLTDAAPRGTTGGTIMIWEASKQSDQMSRK